jgi:hypothetical protein
VACQAEWCVVVPRSLPPDNFWGGGGTRAMLSCVMNEGLSVVTTGSVPCFGGLSYPVAARKASR